MLLVAIAIYLALGVVLFLGQRRMLYFPRVCSTAEVEARAREAGMTRWVGGDGKFLGWKRINPQERAEGTVMIAYGNGSSAVGCARYVDSIQRLGAFDCYILEYPGYQDRPGKPSENSIFGAADEAFASLPTNAPIYMIGESLGSGVTSYLAGKYPERAAGMAALSPFNNLTDVGQSHIVIFPVRWLIRDRYASDEHLKRFRGRLAVMIDGRDFTVPERFGRRLFDGYGGPKRLWYFPESGHIQIEQPEIFWREVFTFLRAPATPSSTE